MKSTIRHIFIAIISTFFAGFLLIFSLQFGEGKSFAFSGSLSDFPKKITYFTPQEIVNNDKASLEYTPLNGAGIDNKNKIFSANFGTLATSFFMPDTGFISPEKDVRLSFEKDTDNKVTDFSIIVENVRGVLALYNPFVKYKITDAKNNYRITQITNGSMYVSSEQDGMVRLYSVDMVAELEFLSEGKTMTKMIIFPGMYVYFPPNINKRLINADLFQIMLALEGEEPRGGIGFLDVRVQATKSKDTFFVSNLPIETRPLFHFLQVYFDERVRTADLLEQYTLDKKVNTSLGRTIKNPSQHAHALLGQLQMNFSYVANGKKDSKSYTAKQFSDDLIDIQNQLDKYGQGNFAKKQYSALLQKLLVDGRFALFMKSNREYDLMYQEVAKILKQNPVSDREYLFQRLSNIFSKNLHETATELNRKIDSYQQAINALKLALSDGKKMTPNEYFDFSLYMKLIFDRMLADPYKIDDSILKEDQLYDIYRTIFSTTQKYAKGQNKDAIPATQKSLALIFYEPMLDILINSLYQAFTIEEDGYIFLHRQKNLYNIDHKTSNLSENFIRNLSNDSVQNSGLFNLAWSLFTYSVFPNIDSVTKNRMEAHLLRGEAFVLMIKRGSGNYGRYMENPYKAVKGKGVPLPEVNVAEKRVFRKNSSLIHQGALIDESYLTKQLDDGLEKKEDENIQNKDSDKEATAEAPIDLAKVFGIPLKQEEVIKDTKVFQQFVGTQKGLTFTGLYNEETNTIENGILSFKEIKNIHIKDSLSVKDFTSLLKQIAPLESILIMYYKQEKATEETPILLLFKDSAFQIGKKLYKI